jgi:hypothetical protein
LSANDASSSRNLINCQLISNLFATDLQKGKTAQFDGAKGVGESERLSIGDSGVETRRNADTKCGVPQLD